MNEAVATIPLARLLFALAPVLLVAAVLRHWSGGAGRALYATGRMLGQLLAVGYVLVWIFETDRGAVVLGVLAVMLVASSWIALRPLRRVGQGGLGRALGAIAVAGGGVLAIVTQLVLDLPRWFEPHVVVPLAGMIFANAMNTVSLAAERFEAERARGLEATEARRVALEAGLIPLVNGLLAVGLVALPGMMTGQILSGVDPLVAVRYQIMVMLMVFGAGGLGAACYLALRTRALA